MKLLFNVFLFESFNGFVILFIEILACHNDNSSISFLKTGYKESDDPTYQEIENGNWYFNETYGTIHRIASAGVRLLGRVYFACGNPDYSTVISTLSIASNSNFWASSKVSPLVII